MSFYYLDTSIWIDWYEKRAANGEHALQCILKIIAEEGVILYSDLHILELKNVGYETEEINTLFHFLPQKFLRHVHIYKEQIAEARKIASLRNIPKNDALHAIIARDSDALLISRDKHFELLKHIVEVYKPEELY